MFHDHFLFSLNSSAAVVRSRYPRRFRVPGARLQGRTEEELQCGRKRVQFVPNKFARVAIQKGNKGK